MRQPCWRHLHPSKVGAFQICTEGAVGAEVRASGGTALGGCQGAFPVFTSWGVIWVGDGFGKIWSQDLDGNVLWHVQVNDLVDDISTKSLVALPLATDQSIVFYIGDQLICLEAKSGQLRWIAKDSRGRDLLGSVESPPQVFMGPDFEDLLDIDEDEKACYVLSRRGVVRAYSLENGDVLGWYPTLGPTEPVPGGFLSFGFEFPPDWSPGSLGWVKEYVGGLTRRVPAVSSDDVGRGLIIWWQQAPWVELRIDDQDLLRVVEKGLRCHASAAFAFLLDSAAIATKSECAYCLSRNTGQLSKIKWPEPLLTEAGLAVGERRVFGILADESVCCLDAIDGEMWKKPLPEFDGGSDARWIGIIPQGGSSIIIERGGGVYRWDGGDEDIETLGSDQLSDPVLHAAADGVSNRLFLSGETSWTILEIS